MPLETPVARVRQARSYREAERSVRKGTVTAGILENECLAYPHRDGRLNQKVTDATSARHRSAAEKVNDLLFVVSPSGGWGKPNG
jgi:hypothetical protein